MVTNRDVAQKAGVSLATVSHVVNRTRPVSADTRKKVERAIKTLDYHPSALARSLSTRSTRTIGLMVGSIALPLTAHLYRALETSLGQKVVNWLRAGYPAGVPGPDRVPLLALLRNTPLTEDQVKERFRGL